MGIISVFVILLIFFAKRKKIFDKFIVIGKAKGVGRGKRRVKKRIL
jgi:hypothetical protein